LEERHSTDSADALEERYGANPADTVERYSTDSANALVS
jgi:hypothetical protein